jgi:hypothetical protein
MPFALVTAGGKLLAVGIGPPFDGARTDEWPDAAGDLRLFLGPELRLPFDHQIAKRLDPHVG